jgi:hypothetical protein
MAIITHIPIPNNELNIEKLIYIDKNTILQKSILNYNNSGELI